MMPFYRFVVVTLLLLSAAAAAQPGCPAINAGPDQTVDCNNNCTTLAASVFPTGATTSYTVASIPYTPPFPFNQGTQLFIGTDDIWSGLLPVPFNFCYYGNTYNQIVVGSNGIISFNAAYAGEVCPWAFTANCPNAALPASSIFGAYHDIDPSVCGQIRYSVLGAAPCRTFVVNYNGVCHFSCTSLTSTTQIVLYETTNVIEVYMQNKPTCSGWNGGRAIIGIQNANGSAGLAAPGRNSAPTWTANNEAWRFSPSGPPAYTVAWFNGASEIGTGLSVSVCVDAPTTFTAQVTYDGCGANNLVLTDNVIVDFVGLTNIALSPADAEICPGGSVDLQVTGSAATVSWSPAEGLSSAVGSVVQASPSATTTYTASVTAPNGCEVNLSTTVTVLPTPVLQLSPGGLGLCPGQSGQVQAVGAATYSWLPDTGVSDISSDTFSFAPSATSVYTVTGTSAQGCTSTATLPVEVFALPIVSISPAMIHICTGEETTLTASGADTYDWQPLTGQEAQSGNDLIVGPASTTTYNATGTDANGCQNQAFATVFVLPIIQSAIDQPGILCTADNVPLSLTAGGFAGTFSGTGVNSAQNTFTPQVAGPGVHTVTFVPSAQCVLPTTANITVEANPDPAFVLPATICEFELPITLTATSAGGQWSGPGITDAAAGTFNPTVAGQGVHLITYTVGANCTSTLTQSIQVTGIQNLLIAAPDQICINAGPIQLQANQAGGTWTGPGISNMSNGTFNPAQAGLGAHLITYTIAGLCGASTTHTLTVNPIPQPQFAAGPMEGCAPLTVHFDNSTTASQSCQWLANGTVIQQGCAGFNHTFAQAGVYDITLVVTNAFGCTATLTQADLVLVVPMPEAIFTWEADYDAVDYTDVAFSNLSVAANQFLWTVNTVPASSDVDFVLRFAPNETRAFVCLLATNELGCENEICHPVLVRQPFYFYMPNAFTPNGDGLNEVFKPSLIGHASDGYLFVIYDRWGQEVFRTTNPDMGWTGNHHPMGQFFVQNDIYTWRVDVGELTTSNRLVYRGHVVVIR